MSRLGRKLLRSLREASDIYDLYEDRPLWVRIKQTIYLSSIMDIIFDPYYNIVSFISRVIRLIQFIPVIWRTHDWDSSYTLDIWAYSLDRLRIGCQEKGHHVTTKNQRRRAITAVNLLKRLSNHHDYTDAHLEYFHKKWGHSQIYFEPTDHTKKYFSMRDKLYDSLTPKQKQRYDKEFRAAFGREQEFIKQDMELLFKILEKDLLSWWD